MSTLLTPAKILLATAVAVLGFLTTGVMARPSAHSLIHHRHLARHEFVPAPGYLAGNGISSNAFGYRAPAYGRMPEYIYAPRKGIIDEAGNLPTSGCPNEMRDVQ